MSLPYFKDWGWEAEVVTVKPGYSDIVKDPVLTDSVPLEIPIHWVNAFSTNWTSKISLGSIALRSIWFYKSAVNKILKERKFDLVYFSTTQFAVCILGTYWKKKFGVPFIIDIQDLWHSDFYKDKPKGQRPPKYWFSYRLDKYLEPIALKKVDGLISVSEAYLLTMKERYKHCRSIPQATITFAAFEKDRQIARDHGLSSPSVLPHAQQIKIVYIGRGGLDMTTAVTFLFKAFKECLDESKTLFEQCHFYFLGTSYASAGKGTETILPIAFAEGIGKYVTENTDRIGFYETINTLCDAEALFIPGSNDPQYTASKIYPYIMARKPLLALFHPLSSVINILETCNVGTVIGFDTNGEKIIEMIKDFLHKLIMGGTFNTEPNPIAFKQYSAEVMTQKQCELFDLVAAHLPNK